MICFESFSYSNFEGVGSSGVKYVFENGMTRLVGENGAGKSSLANGVYFNLTGKPYKKVVIKSLINTINKKGLKTELIFKKNDVRYRIVRNLAPDKFEIYKETEGVFVLEKHLSAKTPYQNILDDILGCDRKVLEQVLIRSNIKANSFLALEKQEKRDYLDKTVDIFILQKIKKKTGSKIDELKAEIDSFNSKLQQVSEKITIEQANISRLEKLKDEMNEERKAVIEEKIAKTKKSFSALKEEIVALKLELKEVETERDTLNQRIAELKEELGEAQSSLLKVHTESCSEVEKSIGLKFQAQKQELEKKLLLSQDKFTKDMEELDTANTVFLKENKVKADLLVKEKQAVEVEKKESALKLSAEIKDLTLKKNNAQKDVDVFNQKYAFFKENCGSCDKLKVLETSENITDKESLIEEITSRLKVVEAQIVKNDELFEVKLKALSTSIEEVSAEKNKWLVSYEKQYDSIDLNYVSEQKKIKEELKEIGSKEASEIKSEKQLLELGFQTKKAEFEKDFFEKISAINIAPIMVAIKGAQQSIDFKTDTAKKVADEGQTLKKELEGINKDSESKIDKTNLDLYTMQSLSLQVQIIEKEKHLNEYSIINNVLTKDNGIRNWILKKFLGFINSKINEYLEEMNETIIFTFNENLEEIFKDKIRAGLSFENLSEGQKKRIDLAILLTFLDVANMQARNKFNLIFLDEILFGLHESIIPLVMKIFEKRKGYQEVIVMEHNKISDTYFDKIFEFKLNKEFFTTVNLKK